jgi:hypothetical protein
VHPAPVIPQHVQDEQTSQDKDKRRTSSRLADKPNAKLHSIARCQTVLLKKLDLMPASQPPKEDHKKRLLGLFSETISPQAIAAVEDLLSDGNSVDGGEGCRCVMADVPAAVVNYVLCVFPVSIIVM